MTRLSPDIRCTRCGSALVPPEVESDIIVPTGTDYVCSACGVAYAWTNDNPPRLVRLDAPIVRNPARRSAPDKPDF